MLYLIGNPMVTRISGKTYQETDMDAKRRATSGYNVEELGLGFVRFDGGLTLDIIEAWAMHMDKLDGSIILGSQGGVRIDPFGYFRSLGDLDLDATASMSGFDWRLHTVRERWRRVRWPAAALGGGLAGPRAPDADGGVCAQYDAHFRRYLSLRQVGP